MNTLAGGLGPTSKTTDAILDIFLAQIDDLHVSAGIAHALHKVIEHQFGFTLSSTSGAGNRCQKNGCPRLEESLQYLAGRASIRTIRPALA